MYLYWFIHYNKCIILPKMLIIVYLPEGRVYGNTVYYLLYFATNLKPFLKKLLKNT